MTPTIPDRLRTGDLIAVISPASPLDDTSRLNAGVRYLEQLGYRVKVAGNVGKRSGYLAGTELRCCRRSCGSGGQQFDHGADRRRQYRWRRQERRRKS
jgi:hypothetical protein